MSLVRSQDTRATKVISIFWQWIKGHQNKRCNSIDNWPKEHKTLRYKSNKTCTESMRKITECWQRALNTWRDIPCSLTGRLDKGKMSVLPKLIYRLMSFSPKSNKFFFFFVDTDRLLLKFIWTGKDLRITKTIMNKNNIHNVKADHTATLTRECGLGGGVDTEIQE